MAQVEQKWLDLALQSQSLDCDASHNAPNCTTNTTRNDAVGNFSQSCHTVAKAVMRTASGDRSRVQAYMSNVCGQDKLKGKPEELCLDFSQYLVKEMSEYQHENMEGGIDLFAVCQDFFNKGYLAHYAQQEREAREAEQAAIQAEWERKQEQDAQAQANAEFEVKAKQARERLEAMHNATAQADAKRQEAVQAAVEAQRKAQASEDAVEMQQRLKAEADAAQQELQAAKQKADAINQRVNSKDATATEQATSDNANTTAPKVQEETVEAANNTASKTTP